MYSADSIWVSREAKQIGRINGLVTRLAHSVGLRICEPNPFNPLRIHHGSIARTQHGKTQEVLVGPGTFCRGSWQPD
jgi:hypothetical protein